MSVTATTEACPASWPQPQPYWLETDDGKCVPLILSDPSSNLVVFKLDTKLKAKGHALKMELRPPTPTAMSAHRSPSREPSIQPYPPPKPLASAFVASKHDHTGSGLPRRQPFGSNLDAIMRNSYPDNPSAFPRSPTDPDRKEFCSYWIRHGECDYMQQGCRYKHEMPDLMTLRSIGFRHVPEWHKEKMRMRTMRRPDLHNLQSILNQNNDDSASEDGSDGSNDTRPDAPHRLTISPSAAGVIVRSVPRSPAPSTIDLLSFDSETDSETDSTPSQTPTVPENTPETSSYSLPYPPTTNRQGRFVPAGESLPRMSTPPLLPSPPSPSFYRKKKPKSQALEKTVYTSPTRRSPIYKQYFKDAKPIKSQETLVSIKEEKTENFAANTIRPFNTTKDTQIAELQAKLAALAAATTSRASFIMPVVAGKKVKTSSTPVSGPVKIPSSNRGVGLMAFKHAHPRSAVRDQVHGQVQGQVRDHVQGQVRDQIHGQVQGQVRDHVQGQVRDQVHGQVQVQGQGQGERKAGKSSRSRARDIQKSTEGSASGEKRTRRSPAVRARKVVSPKIVGGEKKDVSISIGGGGSGGGGRK